MHAIDCLKTFNFNVFKQVITGSFNPGSINRQNSKTALVLVRSANTRIIHSAVSKEEVENYINSSDLTIYGHHSPDDFEISFIRNNKLNQYQATIIPKKSYPLGEDISLPDPPDEKGKIFLDFFADEFERIKIRAEHVMNGTFANKKIRSFARRNLQLLRKLYKDSRTAFNKMCSNNETALNQSDLYVVYILNLFIIRCLVFYTDFFKPYLEEDPIAEQTLRNVFHAEMPRKPKYPWLFFHRPILYEDLSDNNDSSLAFETNPAYQKKTSTEHCNIPEELLNEAIKFIKMKGSIRLNCNINVFMDRVFHNYYDEYESGKPMISAERKTFLELLSYFVTDDKGANLNIDSISTMLKPSNIKKRPGISQNKI